MASLKDFLVTRQQMFGTMGHQVLLQHSLVLYIAISPFYCLFDVTMHYSMQVDNSV